MNKKQLVKRTSEKLNLTQKECLDCIDTIVAIIKSELVKGESVVLGDLGRFSLKSYKERKIYNPIIKQSVLQSAKIVPVFKCSKNFKESIR